jgi:hypothetical protein
MKRRVASALAALAVLCLGASAVWGASIESKGFTVEVGATEGGAASCGSGKMAAAGGFKLRQPTNELYPQTTYPGGRKWKVEAYNRNGPDAYKGKAFALCLNDKDLFVRSKVERVEAGMNEIQATARCPEGSKAISGGGKGPGMNTVMRGSFPAGDERSWGARWQFLGEGDLVKSFAVCDPTPRGTRFEEILTVAPQRGARAHIGLGAICKAGDVVGGGFFSTSVSTNYLESRPIKGAWRVEAVVDGGVTLSAYAVCQK